MKYISRITALLLVLMMLTPTFASALTLGTATQGDLNKLYQEASEDGVIYLSAGLLGHWSGLSAFGNLAYKDLYRFQWFNEDGQILPCFNDPWVTRVSNTMAEQKFYCVATDATGNELLSPVYVVPAADISNVEDYWSLLHDDRFLDALGAADTLTIYRLMTDIWNVSMPDGKNLAESVVAQWWSEREETYSNPDLLCSCVVSGAVASDECVLHPNSDLHVNGCSWKQPEISASADVSTPESLLTLNSVVLAAEERPDVDAYAWQNYVYDPAIAGMRWAVVEYVQDTNLYTIQINKESIQTAYRVVIETTDYNLFESKPLYLGGYDFFNWILTNADIQAWMADDSVTLADVVARYNTAADEEDRTNAEDYTYGEEGESVNLKVPQGAFAEDYVMEIAPATLSDATINAVLQSMDATGTAQMQVLTAFDIAFAALSDRTRKLQPAEGTSVALTFEVDTTGIDEALKYLYVYHIANDGTPEVVAGPVEVTFGVQPIPVQAEGFSTYLAMATNDGCPYCLNHEYCVYYYLYAYDAEYQYELLSTAGTENSEWFYDTTLDAIIQDYKNHIAAGETPVLCTCKLMTMGELVAPGDQHDEGCLWYGNVLRVIGLYGAKQTVKVDDQIINVGNYTYQWYHGDELIQGATGEEFEVEFTMQTETYYWEAKPKNGGDPIKSGPILVTAQWTSLGEYIDHAFNYNETNEELYIYLTETLDVDFTAVVDNVEVEKNLADEIMSFWYEKCLADEGYGYTDIFCTCVVRGAISSDECMLHPDALHDETCPWYTEVEVIIPPIPEQPPLYNGNPNGAQYTSNETYSLPMANDRAVILPKGGRALIQSNQASGAQWQVSDGTQWIDIQGETAADIYVTDAKLNTIFELTGIAQLRYFDKTSNVVLASVSVTSQEIAGGEYVDTGAIQLSVEQRSIVSPFDDNDPETNTLRIIYRMHSDAGVNGKDVWEAAELTYPNDGKEVTNISVASPTVVGYAPYILDSETQEWQAADTITVNEVVHEDRLYVVVYRPAKVNYTIKYMLQNLNDSKYTEDENLREVRQALTESKYKVVEEDEIPITGFHAVLSTAEAEIAADGSTTFEIYYDRDYYLMKFELDGGYGVEPIYAAYGAKVEVGTPVKPGYAFNGWTPALPDPLVMPVDGGTYTAGWTAGEAQYTVVFWYENANDTNCSVAGTITVNAKSGDTVSSYTYRNQSGFTGADTTHFTYNANKDETETVAGDGSTVLDVYFTRNTYTITFNNVVGCGKVEHEHSSECCSRTGYHNWHTCNTDNCQVGYEHEHGNSCYKEYSITAKYDADISYVWQTDPIKSMLDQGYVFQSSRTQKYYSFLEKMPEYNVTMTATQWSGNTYTWYYYLEVLEGKTYTEKTRQDGGKTYYEYDSTTVRGSGLSLTYDEDYFPITGFKQRDSDVPDFNNSRVAYLYYVRESYALKFMNYGEEVTDKGGTFLYEADISGTGFTPAYPTDQLEAGAYMFEGWYTDPYFKGDKFVFTGATMPAQDLTLFAHWVPVNHNVNIYLTSELKANEQIGTTQVIEHGGKATEPSTTPTHPTNSQYTFVDWFYMDGTTEKAFDFENMTIRKDMNIYAKWSSTVLVPYTIKYVKQGTTEEIAKRTEWSALAGSTQTFFPKGGAELIPECEEGWFPLVQSHSMTFDIDGDNVYEFEYVARESVPYTVYYLSTDPSYVSKTYGTKVIKDEFGNDVTYYLIAETKTVSDNKKSAVTETSKVIPSYMADAYQKTLVVSVEAGAVNEIRFFYDVNTVNAYYNVIHYIEAPEGEYGDYQDAHGDWWNIHRQIDTIGTIGQTYSATELSIPNYHYVVVENETKTSGKLELGQTLELKLFYRENSVTINYEVVGPDGVAASDVGTVDLNDNDAATTAGVKVSETVKVLTGEAKGATAKASSNTYKFVGWYDEDGTLLSTNANWAPTKDADEAWIDGTTYYAKFVYDVGHLSITKTVVNGTNFEPTQTAFTFTVTLTGKGLNPSYVVKQGNTVVESTWTQNGNVRTGIFTLTATKDAPAAVVIEGILNGTDYTITEASVTGYTTESSNASGSIQPGTTVNADFTNTYSVGSLTVTKTVQGADAPKDKDGNFTDEFTFTLTVEGFAGLKVEVNGTEETLNASGETTFTMKDGEKVIINGIPDGAKYTVKETKNDDYKTTVGAAEVNTVSGTMDADAAAEAAFVNTYKYSHLTITKKGMETGESAIFKVTAKSKYNNDQDLTFTITVPNGSSVTIGELLIGSTYTITEVGSWSNRYAAVSVAPGTIIEGGETVVVTNGDKNQQWLHDEDYVHNDFSKHGSYGN